MDQKYTIWLLVICILCDGIILGAEGNVAANNTTMATDIKLARANITDMSTLQDYSDNPAIVENKCPYNCICNQLPNQWEVICSGEEIKSLELLDLPNRTTSLRLMGTSIAMLYAKDFKPFKILKSVTIDSKQLHYIEPRTFDDLEDLNQIIIQAPKLTYLDSDVFGYLPNLEHLTIRYCGLTVVPNLTNLVSHEDFPTQLTLTNNKFTTIKPYTFKGMPDVYILDLSGNNIHYLPNYAFHGATVSVLDLSNNPLSKLDEDVFVGINKLDKIKLSHTLITDLPTNGLKDIKVLELYTPTLKKFPRTNVFKSIERAKLYYFSHCCAFTYKVEQTADYTKMHKVQTDIPATDCPSTRGTSVRPSPSVAVMDIAPHSSGVKYSSDSHIQLDQSYPFISMSSSFDPINPGPIPSGGIVDNSPGPTSSQEAHTPGWIPGEPLNVSINHTIKSQGCNEYIPIDYSKVQCDPMPNAFNPCSDVMGYVFLRVLIWFVAMTALIGNFIVLLVLLAYRHKMTVPKFLMCNLSFADFCMGLYLIIIASVDVHTLGNYFNFAISWQHGVGCKIAGFISIFSSELSVFTLTVLTIERWYTIIYAIDLNKRIRLRQAAKIIVCAWLFAILFASLPMIGVGNYGVTSMCLPFYVGDNPSSITYAYVLFILLFNAVAFMVICACYVKMYLTVHNPHTVMQQKDSKVAKRMAVLIFTDFACWAPIAIFGLSAAFGISLLSTNQSKVLIVLFYPINSCANPFLYAIFTKAFRRDFFIMLAKYGMFEKQAMKYRGAHSCDPRSYSQAHSYTSTRDGHNKGHYRGSAGSLLTQITNDARSSSIAACEKDAIHEVEMPEIKSSKSSNIFIPLMLLKDSTNPSANLRASAQSYEQPQTTPTSSTTEVGNMSANNNKQPLMKKLSAVLHVDFTNSDLDTVPEEHCSSPDSPELFLEVPYTQQRRSFSRAPDAHDYVDDDISDVNSDDNEYLDNKRMDNVKYIDNERKNSRTDSGIQSNTTTPTDRADHQIIVNKTRVLELLKDESDQGTETTL